MPGLIQSAKEHPPLQVRERRWTVSRASQRLAADAAVSVQLARLRWKLRFTPRNAPGRVKLGGFDIEYNDLASVYTEYRLIFGQRIYDFPPPETPDALVIDGGSHVGLSLLRFRQIAPGCRLIGFEPDPDVFAMLQRNVQQHGCGDARLVQAGLAARDGQRGFHADGADGGTFVWPGGGATTRPLPTVRLSPYLGEPVEFLKLNIEGAECEVLAEAEAQLANVKRMVIEYHGFPECGQRLHELLALLDRRGFRYLVNHFDYETNPAARPPFRVEWNTRFFLLIAATRVGEATRTVLDGFANVGEPAVANHEVRGTGCGGRATVARDAATADAAGSGSGDAGAAAGRDRSAAPRSADAEIAAPPQPVSRKFGFDRGQPIDRYYIESFLRYHRDDIAGRVLEVGGHEYTRRFGGTAVTHSDVLNARPSPGTTIIADLASATGIPDASFDCFILTQTLPFVFDTAAVVRTCRRILRPGGVLLATVPGISQLSRYDAERWGDFWRFTPQSLARLFGDVFGVANLSLTTYGNVKAAAAFLYGLAAHEVSIEELNYVDEDYPVLIGVRCVR